LIVFFRSFFLTKTRIVFCNVGQGDSAYIRTVDNIDILIDAGPSKSVLYCLGKYMPFFDRTIELVLLSHPQKDHYGGLIHILDRYKIEKLVTIPVDNTGTSFDLLKKQIAKEKIMIYDAYSGDRIRLGKSNQITFLWPNRDFLSTNVIPKRNLPHQNRGQVLGINDTNVDLNYFSQVFLFKQNSLDVLFTGDIDFTQIEKLNFGPYLQAKLQEELSGNLEILKVPHHGSKHGLNNQFLKLADPQVSVISVGKKNSYGHPAKEILDIYKALDKKYLTTKDEGDIVIEVNERNYSMKTKDQTLFLSQFLDDKD